MTVEERLEKVERELARANRLLSGVFICIGIGLVIWAFLPPNETVQAPNAVTEVIRAHGFALVDEQGKLSASLVKNQAGPELRLFDENGKSPIVLGVTTKGAILYLSDENGPRLGLGVGEDGPAFMLWEEGEKLRAAISLFENPVIQLLDENGKVHWTAP